MFLYACIHNRIDSESFYSCTLLASDEVSDNHIVILSECGSDEDDVPTTPAPPDIGQTPALDSDQAQPSTAKVLMNENMEIVVGSTIHRTMAMTCKPKAKECVTYAGGRAAAVSIITYFS